LISLALLSNFVNETILLSKTFAGLARTGQSCVPERADQFIRLNFQLNVYRKERRPSGPIQILPDAATGLIHSNRLTHHTITRDWPGRFPLSIASFCNRRKCDRPPDAENARREATDVMAARQK
jgi:hypothetical protein